MISPCIIDTNVVVGGLLTGEAASPPRRIVDAMLAGRLDFLLSLDLLREYREVLLHPSVVACHGLTEAEVDEVLRLLALKAMMCHPPPEDFLVDDVVTDPGDVDVAALLSVEPEALVVTDDRRLATDLEGICRLATPARLVTWPGALGQA